MDLLDRYLQAIKKHLPWQRQDDIIAELRANLEAQLEDKVAALGRPLTTGEAEAWLKQLGSPVQVAARYQPQQYLIGPAVFPTYWVVLRMACFWALVIFLIVSAVQIFVAGIPSGTAVLEALLRVPGVLMTTAAWVTLIFAAIEFVGTHYSVKFPAMHPPLASWSPGILPPVEKGSSSGGKQRSYSIAVAKVIFGLLILAWLLLLREHPYLLWGPGAASREIWNRYISPFQFAPVWIQFYWSVVALALLQLAWRCLDLWRGSWQKPRLAQHLTMRALGLIPPMLLLTARDHIWFTLKNPALDHARYGGLVNSINPTLYRGLLFICALVALQLVFEIGRMILDVYRKRAAAMS